MGESWLSEPWLIEPGVHVAEGNRFGAWCLSLPNGRAGVACPLCALAARACERRMSNPGFIPRASGGWIGVLSIVNQVLVRPWAYRCVMVSDWWLVVVMRDWPPLTGEVYVQGRLRRVLLVMVARVAVCMC